jgi:hypothetical protein
MTASSNEMESEIPGLTGYQTKCEQIKRYHGIFLQPRERSEQDPALQRVVVAGVKNHPKSSRRSSSQSA